ncbi:hypothetical protein [Elizabethkingia anophelis]|uniref:hypothetical protein n=1 Tax=Elizabethkingia anophelis TaxID=1117645 RepID=UPI002937200A
MKQLLRTLAKLYNFKIILLFITVFILVQLPLLQKVPDFLQLASIETPQSYLFRLLSISIGFSSFILTTFLVIYNVFSKRLKRNSFDFILDNPWINLIFSIFVGSLIFHLLSILTIQISSTNTVITLVYFSTFVVFTSLLLQFPLIILSIRHSSSFRIVKKMIEKITTSDIDNLYNPNYTVDDAYMIEELEKNILIQIKDIGVSSIKDDDWGMPQTILNDLFEKFIEKADFDLNNIKQLDKNLYSYIFVSRHFQKVALDSTDEITIKVALANLFRIHTFFIEKKIKNLKDNPVDENFRIFLRNISDNKSFYNIQQYLLVNLIKMIEEHIKSVSYSDMELPTSSYIFQKKDFDYDKKDELISNYWFYIKNELPSLLFDILMYAIETKNNNIYSHFNWKLHSLFNTISNSKNLTESQEIELFKEFSFKTNRVYEHAIEYNIYEDIGSLNHIQIEIWIEKKKKYALWAFYDFSRLIHKLNKANGLNRILIDDYFTIARSISSKKIDKEDKKEVFESIIKNGFEIYNLKTTLLEVKQEVKNQLKSLNKFIEKENDLQEIKSKYSLKITKLK